MPCSKTSWLRRLQNIPADHNHPRRPPSSGPSSLKSLFHPLRAISCYICAWFSLSRATSQWNRPRTASRPPHSAPGTRPPFSASGSAAREAPVVRENERLLACPVPPTRLLLHAALVPRQASCGPSSRRIYWTPGALFGDVRADGTWGTRSLSSVSILDPDLSRRGRGRAPRPGTSETRPQARHALAPSPRPLCLIYRD